MPIPMKKYDTKFALSYQELNGLDDGVNVLEPFKINLQMNQ
jgi:hypothetical protein